MAIAVVVVWGLTYISTKVLIQQGLHPHEIFFYRFLVAYAGIWLIAPRRLLANSWKEEGLLALAGFFGGSLYFYTENTALGLTQASNVAFLLCTAPLLTAFLSAAFYKEDRLTRRLLMGSMLALCGVGLIVFGGKEGLKVSPAGDLLTLCAAFSWACYSLVIRRLSGRYPVSFITRKVFFYGVLTILPLFAVFPFRQNTAILCRSEVWSNLLFLALDSFVGLLCGLERGTKENRCAAYFQLYLPESAGHLGSFHTDSGRRTDLMFGSGCCLHSVWRVLGGKKEMKHTDAGRSLGKSLHRNRDFLLDREKYLPNFVSE